MIHPDTSCWAINHTLPVYRSDGSVLYIIEDIPSPRLLAQVRNALLSAYSAGQADALADRIVAQSEMLDLLSPRPYESAGSPTSG